MGQHIPFRVLGSISLLLRSSWPLNSILVFEEWVVAQYTYLSYPDSCPVSLTPTPDASSLVILVYQHSTYTMGSHNLPSPPAEDPKAALSRKSTSSSTKSTKPANRISKRAGSTGNAAHAHHHDHVTQGAGMDARHKRVWKACERCRMKKTKVCLIVLLYGPQQPVVGPGRARAQRPRPTCHPRYRPEVG